MTVEHGVNYYEVLQVSRSASDSVIRASYRILIQQYHPDRYTPREEAERITRALNEAYATLSDPKLRRAFDIRSGFVSAEAPPSGGTDRPEPPPANPKPDPVEEHSEPEAQEGGPNFIRIVGFIVWVILLQRLWNFAVGYSTEDAGEAAGQLMGSYLIILALAGGVYTVLRIIGHIIKKPRVPMWLPLSIVTGFLLLGTIGIQHINATSPQRASQAVTPTTPSLADVPALPGQPSLEQILEGTESTPAQHVNVFDQFDPKPAVGVHPVQPSPEADWNTTTTAWEQRNAAFMAVPGNRERMQQAINAVGPGSGLSARDILGAAEKIAFRDSGWSPVPDSQDVRQATAAVPAPIDSSTQIPISQVCWDRYQDKVASIPQSASLGAASELLNQYHSEAEECNRGTR